MLSYVDLLVVALPVAIAATLILSTRGICYFRGGSATDQEKLVRMAREISLLSWPSRMHSIDYGRGQLREYWVIALRLLMKFTGMKGSDHVNVTLALVANAASSILIFYVARSYFGEITALFVFFMYVTCVWPYHVALLFGHIILSQAFFLASVLALTLTSFYPDFGLPLFLLSGILIGISFASSSSSRKFPILYLAALLYQTKDYFVLPTSTGFDTAHLLESTAIIGFALPAAILAVISTLPGPLGTMLVKWLARRLGRDATDENQDRFDALVKHKVRALAAICIGFLLLIYIFQPAGRFYLEVAVSLAGLLLVVIHITAPDFVINVQRYRVWLNSSGWSSHFHVYESFDKQIFGRTLPGDFRGGGTSWVPRFLFRMAPIVAVTYVTAGLTLVAAYIYRVTVGDLSLLAALLGGGLLILVSLLPILVAELTKSLQLGRTYFSAFAGLLVLMGAAAAAVVSLVGEGSAASNVLKVAAIVLVLVQAVMTLRSLVTDQLPARLGPARLYKSLKANGIKAFYTYDIPYNQPFVGTMLYSHPDEFEVRYIQSIGEVTEGHIVVPPTSSKSVEMESDSYGARNGDFRSDAVLASLLDSGDIEEFAVARLNTLGCSRYYVHESEVTTYRDIFLKQVGDHDRWLGHGWVIDADRLASVNQATVSRDVSYAPESS